MTKILYEIMAGSGTNQPLEAFTKREKAEEVILTYAKYGFPNAYIRERHK